MGSGSASSAASGLTTLGGRRGLGGPDSSGWAAGSFLAGPFTNGGGGVSAATGEKAEGGGGGGRSIADGEGMAVGGDGKSEIGGGKLVVWTVSWGLDWVGGGGARWELDARFAMNLGARPPVGGAAAPALACSSSACSLALASRSCCSSLFNSLAFLSASRICASFFMMVASFVWIIASFSRMVASLSAIWPCKSPKVRLVASNSCLTSSSSACASCPLACINSSDESSLLESKHKIPENERCSKDTE